MLSEPARTYRRYRLVVRMIEMSVWTEPGGCSTCKYCGMDMEMNPFCVHREVTKKYPYGLNINNAIKDYCGKDLKLREEI